MVHVSESNLITIAGGKWTTYRVMAQETVDTAVQVNLQSFYPVADPDPVSCAFWESGMEKKLDTDPGSGMKIPDYFPRA